MEIQNQKSKRIKETNQTKGSKGIIMRKVQDQSKHKIKQQPIYVNDNVNDNNIGDTKIDIANIKNVRLYFKDKIEGLLDYVDQQKVFFRNKFESQKQKGKFHDVEKDVLKYEVKIYKSIFQKIAQIIDINQQQRQDGQDGQDKKNQCNNNNKNQQIFHKNVNLNLPNLLKLLSEQQTKNMSLQNNVKVLQQKNQKLEFMIKKLKQNKTQDRILKDHNQLQNKFQSQSQRIFKQLQVYKRKADQFDKLGGRTVYQKFKSKIKDLNQTIESHNQQKQKLKDKIKELTNKCQILATINNQTQNQLAELMTQKSYIPKFKSQKPRIKSTFSTAYDTSVQIEKQKQNNQNNANLNVNVKENQKKSKNILNPNIEIMALKQQINKYRRQVEMLQIKNKELVKKCNDKQVFFSKLVQYS